jgi:peptidoglycan/LPS O-acetylase OafA/YrhL
VPFGSPALVAGAAAVLTVGAVLKPLFAAACPLAGGYLLFSLAFAPWVPFHRTFAKVDLSYGVYVYGWPVQQACVYALGIREPALLFGASMAVIVPLAWLSWTFIEQPCLRRMRGHLPTRTPCGS